MPVALGVAQGEASKSKRGERLNWEQACRVFGCGKTHFYHLVNSGALPAYRSGGKRGLWVWEKDCRELIMPVLEGDLRFFCMNEKKSIDTSSIES